MNIPSRKSTSARLQESEQLIELVFDGPEPVVLNNSQMLVRHQPHVVVVGAGIVGAATTYFLTQAGASVTLVEGEAPAAGATGASDGAVSVGTKRPGPMMRVAQRARGLFAELADAGPFRGLYHPRPTLLIARNALEMSLVRQHAADLEGAGEPAEIVDRPALVRMMPGLGRDVEGAAVVPRDGHALGYQLTAQLLDLARPNLLRHTPVLAIETQNGAAVGVRTGEGSVRGDVVVIAAGLGCRQLLDLSDILLPRKGQMIITDRVVPSGPALSGHIISAAYLAAKRATQIDQPHIGLVIDPLMTGQLLIGGSRETNREDRQTDAATIAAILREAIDLYPAVAHRRVIRTFAGIRTATIDGLPIVGRVPGIEELVVATGFEGDGICLGPLMGAVAADLALGRPPTLDIAAFDPARFVRQEVRA